MDAETEARLREMADGQRDAGAEPEKTAEGSTPSSGGRGPSQATVLVGLALDAGIELFHNPASEPFATLPIDGRKETWPLKSKVVKRWLQRLFYESTEKAASNDGTQSALGVL
ncbi:MAG: hypothetical protein ACREMY_12535, partial [bacterium]